LDRRMTRPQHIGGGGGTSQGFVHVLKDQFSIKKYAFKYKYQIDILYRSDPLRNMR
jgi:hypothetical protein